MHSKYIFVLPVKSPQHAEMRALHCLKVKTFSWKYSLEQGAFKLKPLNRNKP